MSFSLIKTKAYDPTDAVMGISADGTVFRTPISKGPHWLIAGQTGSGKSVYMNSILISMLFHAIPNELILMAIDPKKVEFAPYKGLPYCPVDPVTDMGDAYGLLAYLCWEMDERYERLQEVGVKNIEEFNTKFLANEKEMKEQGYEYMKYIVCVIDEYADLIMQQKSVETLIVRLAQKARAAGISLLIATQRPSVDIISSIVKANVPARIGLKTADQMNSMVILDEGGCEKLAGYGDSIIKLTNGDMIRVQGPYITNEEIDSIFTELKNKYGKPTPFDYKTLCVEKGLADWAEKYEEDVPIEKRHVKEKKMSMFGGR